MAYFNQLQGYMSNLKEGQAHMDDMKNEAINKKTAGIEDKFNAISQQAQGWGGAITGGGIVWKHGRKVIERLGKAKQDATSGGDGTSATTSTATSSEATTSNLTEVGANDFAGIGNAADHIASSAGSIGDRVASGISSVVKGIGAGADSVGGAAAAVGGDGASGASSIAQTLNDARQAVGGSINVIKGSAVISGQVAGGGTSGANIGDAINASGKNIAAPLTDNLTPSNINLATRTGGRSAGDGAGGGAAPNEGSLADNAGDLGDTAGSIGSRVASGVRSIATGLGADADGAVMGAVNATLDSIPIIGELVGIGTLVGGLIHGLHKGGENSKEAAAQGAGGSGSAAGGIATKVFQGNTLGGGGGGYIA